MRNVEKIVHEYVEYLIKSFKTRTFFSTKNIQIFRLYTSGPYPDRLPSFRHVSPLLLLLSQRGTRGSIIAGGAQKQRRSNRWMYATTPGAIARDRAPSSSSLERAYTSLLFSPSPPTPLSARTHGCPDK